MTIADSNRGRIAFVAESTFGVTPSTPTMKLLRVTQADFGSQKDTAVSNEIRADRMVAGIMEVGATATGSFDFELSLGGAYDTFLEAVLCGTFSTAINATSVAVTASNNFSVAGIGANASVGQYVYAAGFSNAENNGWHLITAVTTNAITVATTLTVESAGSGTVKGKLVRNGTVARSFSIEEGFTDIGQFFQFSGQRVGSWSMDCNAGQLVTGKFGFQGTKGSYSTSTISSALTAAPTNLPVNATTNFGKIQEGTSLVDLATGVQGFSMSLDNALRNQMASGSKYPYGIGYGRQQITGTLNAYFENTSLYAKFLNHTATGLAFSFADATGNAMRVTLPRVYFTTSNPNVTGVDQDVMEQLQWTAIADTTGTYQIQVDIA